MGRGIGSLKSPLSWGLGGDPRRSSPDFAGHSLDLLLWSLTCRNNTEPNCEQVFGEPQRTKVTINGFNLDR